MDGKRQLLETMMRLGHPAGSERDPPREGPLMLRDPRDEGPVLAPHQDFISSVNPDQVLVETMLQQLRKMPPDVVQALGYRQRTMPPDPWSTQVNYEGSPWAPSVKRE